MPPDDSEYSGYGDEIEQPFTMPAVSRDPNIETKVSMSPAYAKLMKDLQWNPPGFGDGDVSYNDPDHPRHDQAKTLYDMNDFTYAQLDIYLRYLRENGRKHLPTSIKNNKRLAKKDLELIVDKYDFEVVPQENQKNDVPLTKSQLLSQEVLDLYKNSLAGKPGFNT